MSPAHIRRDVITVFAVFALNGALIGSWTSRIPAVKQHLAVDLGTLGLVFLCLGLGSLVSMPLTGFVLKVLSPKQMSVICVLGASSIFATLSQVTQVWAFAGLYALAGFFFGAWDVTVNVQGAAVEAASGRTIMPALHGMWGGGMLLGAATGTLVTRLGVGLGPHILVAMPVVAVLTLVAVSTWTDYRAHTAASHADSPQSSARGILVPVLLIGVMMLCSTIGEGSAADWIALQLIEDKGSTASIGASAYTVYALFLTVSRLSGSLLIARFGRVNAIRLSGLCTALGVVLVIVAPHISVSFLGAALWGAGLAVVFPAGISAASEVGGRHSDHAIAIASTLAYGGFLIGPALLGLIAHHSSLSTAFAVPATLGLGFAALAFAARERRGTVVADRVPAEGAVEGVATAE
ncbi:MULTISPECIES: MFS transporter [Aestuariimicrobium]|uniref:MFS transporter n=1 Tax=Aestuariimicrobium TaxID=396388 RepID=UPI0003B38BDE|nr:MULTISPECIES: MFS transporter [Aestuariimicrobium]CAI9404153.1 Inner membrane protein YbjJ [Aestuariimicrobium sp. T2.26MG-19.2B]